MKLRKNYFTSSALRLAVLLLIARPFAWSPANAEPLRIAYTSIAVVYGPLWLSKDAGHFQKYNIEPEFVYIAGARL